MFRKRNSLKCSGLTQQEAVLGVTSSTTWERLELFCGSLFKNTLSCVLVRLGSGESSLFKSNFPLVTSIFAALWQCAHALTLAGFLMLLIADILPEKKHPLGFFSHSRRFPFSYWLDVTLLGHSRNKSLTIEILIAACKPPHVHKGMAIQFPVQLCDDIWGIWFWRILEDETHFQC